MNNKTVLVVGCGREGNIGQAVARKFKDEGWFVWGADIVAPSDVIGFANIYEICDVTKKHEVENLMQKILTNHTGRLDAIVNAAGVNLLGPISSYTEEDFDKTIAVNLKSNFLLLQAYYNWFGNKDYDKNFLVVGSDTGMVAKTSTFAYGASKAGVHHFVRCAARELNKYHGGDEWNVTALAIGMVAGTPMDNKTVKDLTEQRGITEEEARNMLTANIPTGRGATPEEVAEWMYFLATKGRYATGNIIRVDSGQQQG